MKEIGKDEILSEFYKSAMKKTEKYLYMGPEEKGQKTGTKKSKITDSKRAQLRKKRKKK